MIVPDDVLGHLNDSCMMVHAMTRIGRTLPKSAQVLLDMVERAIREDTRLGQYEF